MAVTIVSLLLDLAIDPEISMLRSIDLNRVTSRSLLTNRSTILPEIPRAREIVDFPLSPLDDKFSIGYPISIFRTSCRSPKAIEENSTASLASPEERYFSPIAKDSGKVEDGGRRGGGRKRNGTRFRSTSSR